MLIALILNLGEDLATHPPNLLAYLEPEHPLISPKTTARKAVRKHIALLVVLVAVAAVAGAVVLTPSRRTKPDIWDTMRERISKRAEVNLFDDFNTGLVAWRSDENIASTWSYDKHGFVNPGMLSLFEPSMHLTNYDLDMLVQIESKGLGLVFRAASPHTYQVAQLLVVGSGPLRSLEVERFTVLSSQTARPVLVHDPDRFQSDTLYRVHLAVRNDTFSLYIQEHLVAYWSDPRLPTGGIGLFCSPGEHARVAWVRVSHNKDKLGRVCSLLASVL